MLRYGYTEPRTGVGREERDKRVAELLRVLAHREWVKSQIADALGWSDWMTGAVLDAAMASGYVTRRQESPKERDNRRRATGRERRTCWVYKASGKVPPVARESRQPPRLIFRPLGDIA